MTSMITRWNAVNILNQYVGQELSHFAKKHKITIVADSGKINKGWKGHVCQKLIGIDLDNKQAPNGLGFELKTVSYFNRKGLWMQKETMAITMVDADNLYDNDLLHSHLWEKLKRLLFCATSWNGENSTKSKLLRVITVDCLNDSEIISTIQEDYDTIRNKLKTQGLNALTSRDGNYIQARTKGAGHGSVSRAFYAKKSLLKSICPSFETVV